ncbi:hypothetical protein [uncultured Sphingomonas sp.]|uniref:hypothetical protein n=1 Tax=uncultured Sphingomonas sp. TaxID=158754 RepID=UPI0037485240
MAALLAGCAPSTFSDRPPGLSYVEPGQTVDATERLQIDKYHALLTADGIVQTARGYRDAVVWRQISADDERFGAFVRGVRSDRALMNMSADGGAIVLNGVAAVTGTAGEKAALAALAGGLLAAKGSVDRELFNLEAVSAILSRMRAARVAALVPIRAGLAQDVGHYSLEEALRDVRSYVEAGSLLATVDAIKVDAGKVEQKATTEIEEIRRDGLYRDSRPRVDALGVRLRALSDPQMLRLAYAMEAQRSQRSPEVQRQLEDVDNSYHRFESGKNARLYLEQWLQMESGKADELDQWDRAIGIAEGSKPK